MGSKNIFLSSHFYLMWLMTVFSVFIKENVCPEKTNLFILFKNIFFFKNRDIFRSLEHWKTLQRSFWRRYFSPERTLSKEHYQKNIIKEHYQKELRMGDYYYHYHCYYSYFNHCYCQSYYYCYHCYLLILFYFYIGIVIVLNNIYFIIITISFHKLGKWLLIAFFDWKLD